MLIAQLSAKKDGLGRPFFSDGHRLLAGAAALLCLSACAQPQESIYRCGQEYTNAPKDKRSCVRLASQGAVTVIEGTHLNSSNSSRRTPVIDGRPALVPQTRPKVEPDRLPDTPMQRERDTQARTIVMQELEKARQQQAQLLKSYRHGEAEKSQADPRSLSQSQERLLALKAAMERNQRDIDSLQHELARRPVAANP
jgi:hypothetical protein